MVPKGWNQGHIEDFFILQRGFDLTKKSACEGTIPVYSSSGVAYFHNVAKVKGPGVITGRKGSVGPVYLVEEDFWPHDTTLWVKDFRGNHVNYVKYFMDFLRLERFDESSSVPTLNRNNVHGVKCVFPPIYEQKKISQILSTWDKAIILSEQLLINSQQQKKAIMQQLLTGKKRFHNFNAEWKYVRLGDVADINSGGTPKSSVPEYYDGDIPWVSIADMTKYGKFIQKTKKYLTKAGLDNSSARLYPKNTVLYAMYASIGECSIASIEVSSSQAILGIRPKKELHYLYLYFYLSSLKEKIKLQGQQGTQSNLNAGMVKKLNTNLPSIEEQKKIALVLSLADDEVEKLEKKLSLLQDEKKALMQQLLTGKRRVKIDKDIQ
jgi:type I restriction enzyme, S subunit